MARSNTAKDLSIIGSEEVYDFFCQPCSPDKLVEAVGYCQECSEYLCITCINYHGKLSVSKGHTVLDKSAMPKTKMPPKIQITDVLTKKCRKHPDEVLKYFCKSHNQICCSVCVTLDHVSCSNKIYVPDVSSGIAKSQEYKNLRADLNRIIRQITLQLERNNDNSMINDKYLSETLADIADCRQQINDILDAMEEATKSTIAQLHQENLCALRGISEKCQSLLKEVHSMSLDLDKIANAGKNNQLFVEIKLYCDRIVKVEKQMKEADEFEVIRYAFHQDKQIQEMMSSLSDIWSLSLRQDATPTKARYVEEMNVKTKDDEKECDISGLVVLDKERVVVADYSNIAVKLFDVGMNKPKARLQLSSAPNSLTEMDSNKVAAALPLENKIDIITASRVLSKSQSITIHGDRIREICYNKPYFITSCYKSGSIKIIDMSGKTLKTFSSDRNGAHIFTEPVYITLSRDKNVVYVTDYSANSITCMSLTGNVISVYRHDQLKKPRGIDVGKDGAVYVCSYDTYTVHQLTPTGDFMRIMLELDQAKRSNCLAFNDENNRLYISRGNYIRLFQLK